MESLVNDPSSSFLGTSTPTSFSPKNLAIGPCSSGLCREFEEGDICWFVGMVGMVGFDSLDALSWV